MILDLTQLRALHPKLAPVQAEAYAHRAGLGLGRHGHQPGKRIALRLNGGALTATLEWKPGRMSDAEQLDRHRITEEAAEAIALALVAKVREWVVVRKLQQGEAADWLLHDRNSAPVVLEVSGIDKGTERDIQERLRAKLDQALRSPVAGQKVACVVELAKPRAFLATA